MGHHRPASARRLATLVCGLVIAVLVSTDAIALTWAQDTAATASGYGYAYPGGLAVSSATVAHAIYEEGVLGSFVVEYRRTTDSGATWASPLVLSSPLIGEAGVPSIDASGDAVDAVWVEGDNIISSSDSAVVYRRSTDGGVSWHDPVHLSPLFESAGLPRVAHAGSTVVVTWTDQSSGSVWVRVSTDGGVTFKARSQLATTTDKPYTGLYEAFPTVAIGSGVIVVGYYTSSKTLKIRRSTTSGGSWKSSQTIATNTAGNWPAAVAASGSKVLVGYEAKTSSDAWTVVKRSTDKGATFGSAHALSPSSKPPSFQPVITYHSGAFRAAFERCASNSCSTSSTYFMSSTTGSTWSTAIVASKRKRKYDFPADVDVATKVLLLYDDVDNNGNDVWIRRGG